MNALKKMVTWALLAAAVGLSVAMLKAFVREQMFLWPAREESAGPHLLFEPRLQIFRLSPADGGKLAWWFSSTGEPTEGSTGILSLPSWPFAVVALGMIACASMLLLGHGKGR